MPNPSAGATETFLKRPPVKVDIVKEETSDTLAGIAEAQRATTGMAPVWSGPMPRDGSSARSRSQDPAHLHIQFDLDHFGIFDFRKGRQISTTGCEQAAAAIDAVPARTPHGFDREVPA